MEDGGYGEKKPAQYSRHTQTGARHVNPAIATFFQTSTLPSIPSISSAFSILRSEPCRPPVQRFLAFTPTPGRPNSKYTAVHVLCKSQYDCEQVCRWLGEAGLSLGGPPASFRLPSRVRRPRVTEASPSPGLRRRIRVRGRPLRILYPLPPCKMHIHQIRRPLILKKVRFVSTQHPVPAES